MAEFTTTHSNAAPRIDLHDGMRPSGPWTLATILDADGTERVISMEALSGLGRWTKVRYWVDTDDRFGVHGEPLPDRRRTGDTVSYLAWLDDLTVLW